MYFADKRLDGWGAGFQSNLIQMCDTVCRDTSLPQIAQIRRDTLGAVSKRSSISTIFGSCDPPVDLLYVAVWPSSLRWTSWCHHAVQEFSIWYLITENISPNNRKGVHHTSSERLGVEGFSYLRVARCFSIAIKTTEQSSHVSLLPIVAAYNF